jgi:hypothetical protein
VVRESGPDALADSIVSVSDSQQTQPTVRVLRAAGCKLLEDIRVILTSTVTSSELPLLKLWRTLMGLYCAFTNSVHRVVTVVARPAD